MKPMLLLLCMGLILTLGMSGGYAQSNVAAELYGEALFPGGTYFIPGTGYGGGIGLQFDVNKYFSMGFHAGYAVWSLKNGRIENWPLSVSLKYYFIRPEALRVYALVEPGYTITPIENELTISPGLGMEIPTGMDGTALDMSLRYEKHLNGSQATGIKFHIGSLFGF